MALNNIARDEPTEDPQKNQESPQNEKDKALDNLKLTAQEYKAIKGKQTNINKLAAQKKQLDFQAKQKLINLSTRQVNKMPVIDLNEYAGFLRQLEETDSPDVTGSIIKKIEQLEKEKNEQAKADQEKNKEIDPEDPRLLEMEKEFNDICENKKHIIGTKQVPEFEKWIRQQRLQKPSIGHMDNLIKRLNGDIEDPEGIGPRERFYNNNLVPYYRKWNILSPMESDYIAREGLSERKEYVKNAVEMENHLHRMQNLGLYSNKVIKDAMQKMLKAENLHEQTEFLQKARNIGKVEQENLTYLHSKTNVGKYTFNALSEKSKKVLMDFHKDASLTEKTFGKGRDQIAREWKKFVDSEGELGKELEEALKDYPELLDKAVKSFMNLGYPEKQELIKQYKQAAESEHAQEEMFMLTTVKAAEADIERSKDQKTISSKTAKHYKDLFNKKDNYCEKNGTLNKEKLEKMYKGLNDPTPVKEKEKRNLAAYKVEREKFTADLKKLEDINPQIEEDEIKEWQEEYDNGGWKDRKDTAKKLEQEIKEKELEQKKNKKIEDMANINKDDKEKAKENAPKLMQTLRAASELMDEDHPSEALKILLEYNEADPDNPKILMKIKHVAEYMQSFGSGKKKEEKMEKELDQTVEEVIRSDKEIKDELELQQINTLGTELAELSMRRHGNEVSAHKRSLEESIHEVGGDEEETLTEQFYEMSQQDDTVLEKGEAENVIYIDFNDQNDTSSQDRQRLRGQIYQEQKKIDTKEGSSRVELFDSKSSRTVNSDEAKNLQEKELANLEEDITEKTVEKMERKTGKIFNLAERMAARRKAREIIDDERHDKLDRAA